MAGLFGGRPLRKPTHISSMDDSCEEYLRAVGEVVLSILRNAGFFKLRILRRIFVCAIALCLCASCVTTPKPNEAFPVASEPKLFLKAGDVLQVKFLYWPELNEDKQSIRPDGKISLQLVGDVHAEGLSPDELRTQLLQLYEDKLIDPEISVVVSSLDSHRIYVGGEVQNPGLVMIDGRMTALEAIMRAGGPRKESAKLSTVVVIRQREGKQLATTIDLRQALEKPETAVFVLEPGDVIFVPRTAIDRVDQWVEKYINQIVPRSLHYNFTQEVNRQGSSNSGLQAAQSLSNLSNAASNMQLGGASSAAR